MIKLLGIPLDWNSSFLYGTAQAPKKIRHMDFSGASNPFTESGAVLEWGENLLDCGDISFPSQDRKESFDLIFESTLALIRDGSKLISLGGDHSITYPVIKGFHQIYPDLSILHFDAHSDLYEDFEKNPYSHASPFARIMEKGFARSLTQVGLRTLTAHQRAQIERYAVRAFEMRDLPRNFISDLKGPLYISFDLDVLDPAYAPGVSHHEPGGMSVRMVLDYIQSIQGVDVVGADIVEFNPDRDLYDMTAMVGYKMLKEIWALM